MRIVIFDVDGVIFDPTNRLHLMEVDYTAFEKAAIHDPPIQKTIDLMNSFNRINTSILLLTGRSEFCREITEFKLKKHNVPYDEIIMRPIGDDSPSDIFKSKALKARYSKDILSCIVGIYDDEEMNIQAFRAMGLPAFLVTTNH